MLIFANYIFVADVKCGLHEINKNNRANATHGPSPVRKMSRGRTKTMLDRRGPGPGPGPVLTLTITGTAKIFATGNALHYEAKKKLKC